MPLRIAALQILRSVSSGRDRYEARDGGGRHQSIVNETAALVVCYCVLKIVSVTEPYEFPARSVTPVWYTWR